MLANCNFDTVRNENFELVVGLEIHVQLHTETKAFSPEPFEYGASPNTLTSPVTLGLPGALPVLNEKIVELAVRLGLALNCQIRQFSYFSRKNYFYPDLPKGYQITQYETPICFDGFIDIHADGKEPSRIGIERIHLEEDAGKSLHDQDPYETLVDFNRAGAPLVETVSKPDIRKPLEAYKYVEKIRQIVRWLGVSDGNMEEGSLRCDANISVRPKGTETLGIKVEVKNMNSFRHVMRAIEYEFERQVGLLLAEEKIVQETRSFDTTQGITLPMRTKEKAHDYRYFPEPDLPPLVLTEAYIEQQKKLMGLLPDELFAQFTENLRLSDYEASRLLQEHPLAQFFMLLVKTGFSPKEAANWILGPINQWLNENGYSSISEFPLSPDKLFELLHLVRSERISHSNAASILLPSLCKSENSEIHPESLARQMGLLIEEIDSVSLEIIIKELLENYPEKLQEYKNGKKGLTGFFMGELMKKTKGQLNPKTAAQILQNILNTI